MGKKSKNGFYAVRKGRRPGVYTTWHDTQLQVNGFSGAQFKSFPSLREAEQYCGIDAVNQQIPAHSAAAPVAVPPPLPVQQPAAFYAVAKGHRTGIFRTWAEVDSATRGYRSPLYRIFDSQREATRFLANMDLQDAEQNLDLASFFDCTDVDSKLATPTKRTAPLSCDQTPTKYQRTALDQNCSVQSGSLHRIPGFKARSETTSSPSYLSFPSNKFTKTNTGTLREVDFPSLDTILPVRNAETSKAFKGSTSVTTSPSPSRGNINPITNSVSDKATDVSKHSTSPHQMPFYAVGHGKQGAHGVFRSWGEVEHLVDGMHSARFKKFFSLSEAEEYVRNIQSIVKVQPGDPDYRDRNTLVAFCDGSSFNNGKSSCFAGWACMFPHNPSWDIGAQLPQNKKKSNNRAEYLAALAAMRRANQEDPSKKKPLYIFSDSMLLIRSLTEWVNNWMANNWKKSDGKGVLNRDLLEQLVAERGDRRIIWQHVKAHTNKRDWKSVCNAKVDEMAKNMALHGSKHSIPSNTGRRSANRGVNSAPRHRELLRKSKGKREKNFE